MQMKSHPEVVGKKKLEKIIGRRKSIARSHDKSYTTVQSLRIWPTMKIHSDRNLSHFSAATTTRHCNKPHSTVLTLALRKSVLKKLISPPSPRLLLSSSSSKLRRFLPSILASSDSYYVLMSQPNHASSALPFLFKRYDMEGIFVIFSLSIFWI